MALSEQRLNQLNARAADIEERLRGKETELAQTRTQFQQLTADFRYNLKLLEAVSYTHLTLPTILLV